MAKNASLSKGREYILQGRSCSISEMSRILRLEAGRQAGPYLSGAGACSELTDGQPVLKAVFVIPLPIRVHLHPCPTPTYIFQLR